jgi:hypothetical protein
VLANFAYLARQFAVDHLVPHVAAFAFVIGATLKPGQLLSALAH